MNKGLFWGMVASGKCSQEELLEAFEQLSPEDQQAVRETFDRMVEGITRAFENIKQTVTSVAEAFSQWWQSIPDDVKEELKRYGEGNVSKLDKQTITSYTCHDPEHDGEYYH